MWPRIRSSGFLPQTLTRRPDSHVYPFLSRRSSVHSFRWPRHSRHSRQIHRQNHSAHCSIRFCCRPSAWASKTQRANSPSAIRHAQRCPNHNSAITPARLRRAKRLEPSDIYRQTQRSNGSTHQASKRCLKVALELGLRLDLKPGG